MVNEDKQFIQLIRSALTAIDGLWFLEVENKLGFDQAFEIDIQVWKRYGSIIINRIKKILSLQENNLEAFLQVLKILCEIDGTQFEIKKQSPNEVIIQVNYCPWWENLKRSHREKLVRCDIVDKVIFPEWAKYFNPELEFQILNSLPDGHDACEWVIKLKDS
ncbi:MAG TPA: DUF6125 family protein [Candidatus Deferrimicrobium sp.]|nr:DUF6125 family protein [Candidatus Deferrimicrobium sp.]